MRIPRPHDNVARQASESSVAALTLPPPISGSPGLPTSSMVASSIVASVQLLLSPFPSATTLASHITLLPTTISMSLASPSHSDSSITQELSGNEESKTSLVFRIVVPIIFFILLVVRLSASHVAPPTGSCSFFPHHNPCLPPPLQPQSLTAVRVLTLGALRLSPARAQRAHRKPHAPGAHPLHPAHHHIPNRRPAARLRARRRAAAQYDLPADVQRDGGARRGRPRPGGGCPPGWCEDGLDRRTSHASSVDVTDHTLSQARAQGSVADASPAEPPPPPFSERARSAASTPNPAPVPTTASPIPARTDAAGRSSTAFSEGAPSYESHASPSRTRAGR